MRPARARTSSSPPGRRAFEIGGDRVELGKGDAIVFAADVPHAYLNPGNDECWMNLVMTYAR